MICMTAIGPPSPLPLISDELTPNMDKIKHFFYFLHTEVWEAFVKVTSYFITKRFPKVMVLSAITEWPFGCYLWKSIITSTFGHYDLMQILKEQKQKS